VISAARRVGALRRALRCRHRADAHEEADSRCDQWCGGRRGVGLALVADFRVASPGSRFTVNFRQARHPSGLGLTVTLPRLVGQQKAAEPVSHRKRIGGEEAHAIGLVDRSCPMGVSAKAPSRWPGRSAVNAPLAILSIRETLRLGIADEGARTDGPRTGRAKCGCASPTTRRRAFAPSPNAATATSPPARIAELTAIGSATPGFCFTRDFRVGR